jgi:Fe-Mn family superoxide dismutase
MPFQLPELPYAIDALEPHISRRTMEFHYGKHHDAYVKKTNDLIKNTTYAKMTLKDVILKSFHKSDDRMIFDNAAQIWNHSFFWSCMQPNGGGAPQGLVATELQNAFGGYAEFHKTFAATATGLFGSGWVWLVLDGGKLSVIGTPNAETPIASHQMPLLACDVWEHAYYIDYQNQRPAFVEAFLDHLVNWKHVEACLRDADHSPQLRVAASGP